MNQEDRVRWRRRSALSRLVVCVFVVVLVLAGVCGADQEPGGGAGGESPLSVGKGKTVAPGDGHRVPLAVARDRARLMHQIYTATLDVIHDSYFHADRAMVPARAMEDVFENLEQATGSTAHWISVNLRAMSITHDPKTDFEKQAARALGDGKSDHESVDDGVYRRATPIPLHEGCVGCHAGFGAKPSKNPKMAGLVISIPLIVEEASRP